MNKLVVKNMMCSRCISAVEDALNRLKINYLRVRLGEVILVEELTYLTLIELRDYLQKLGFELLPDKTENIINTVKNSIKYYLNKGTEVNILTQLNATLKIENWADIFHEKEGITVKKYYLLQRIERVKKLLVEDDLALSEVALQMNFSSVAYLSSQFKKYVGCTPSQYKYELLKAA